MNKIIVSGRLTKDGETRTIESGKQVYSNSIAVNRKFKNKDGEYETDFFNFTYWNINDKFSQYLKKGKSIIIEGNLQNRSYKDKDGNKKHITEIIVESIELIGESKKEIQEQQMNTKTIYQENQIVLEDNDMPF